jgi:hypothetical protein
MRIEKENAMAECFKSTISTRGLARDGAAPPGFPYALAGSEWATLRALTSTETRRDQIWKQRRALSARARFNFIPPDWHCPGCGKTKYELIRKQKGGRWSSEIDNHHILGFGWRPRILLCRRCNLREAYRRRSEQTVFNSANPWALKYKPTGYVPCGNLQNEYSYLRTLRSEMEKAGL